jgi:prepilin-type N-terminal cleavage/methylation domain-containing protein
MKSRLKINKSRKLQGFSLTEMLIAVFIFSVVMVAVTGVFMNIISINKSARSTQRNLEDGNYAMALMAKTLRTSSVVKAWSSSQLDVYDYSQSRCIRYQFDDASKSIRSSLVNATKKTDCGTVSFPFPTPISITNDYVHKAVFDVIPSNSTETPSTSKLGRVTVSMEVCPNAKCVLSDNQMTTLQTTVSLRDYQEVSPN